MEQYDYRLHIDIDEINKRLGGCEYDHIPGFEIILENILSRVVSNDPSISKLSRCQFTNQSEHERCNFSFTKDRLT